jgi:glucosamine-6-phosphate deaminase
MRTIQPCQTRIIDNLNVQVFETRIDMGTAAGIDVAAKMRKFLAIKPRIRMVFAAAPSQIEFLQTLANESDIDWSRVTAFHMDEYIGLPEDAPQRFSAFLRNHLFNLVQPGEVHLIDCSLPIEDQCRRYTKLFTAQPIDIICLGIGENGHIAFNDPPVADFHDPQTIKLVQLDEACRRQQVNDGCFPELDAVPTHALTLTIPALMSGASLFCIVPGMSKRKALHQTLFGPIVTECPASILRRHPNCVLYTDTAAYGV